MLAGDQMLPHGSAPNRSETARCCQILSCLPAAALSFTDRAARANVVLRRLREAGVLAEMSEAGAALCGLRYVDGALRPRL